MHKTPGSTSFASANGIIILIIVAVAAVIVPPSSFVGRC